MEKAHRLRRAIVAQAFHALGVLLAFCPCVSALDPSLDISQYAHTSWKIRDGFTKGPIFAIAQTPDGYLWLGTDFGVLRFDGVRTVPWQPPAGEQLPSTSITYLLVSRDGTLWIGTQKGLVNWRNGKLTRFLEFGGHYIASLLEDREGTVWVGVLQEPLGKLCAIRNGAVECYGTEGSLGQGALSLYEDTKGNLWVGSPGGLWHWKPGATKFYVLANTGVSSIAEDTDGTLLIAAQSMGIRRVIGGRIEQPQYKLPNSVRGWAAYRMLIDRDGTLWIGMYGGGLVHVHQGRTDTFTQADGLSGNSMNALFEDHEGNIWVATTDGLDHFRNFAIPRWSGREGVPFAPGAAVLATRDGSVWTGGAKALGRLNQNQVLVYRQRPEPGASLPGEAVRETIDRALPENFFALLQDHSGRILVSSPKGQLGYLEAQRYHQINSVGSSIGIAMAEEPSGDLWVDGQQDGLFRLHDWKIVEKVPWDTLGRKDFGSRLTVDRSRGGLWIGYRNGGVILFKDGQLRASYSAADGLGEGVVNDIRFDFRGTLWAATESGLSRIRDGHITTLTSKNGLPCDTVHWTMEDDEHLVWLYMSCGLVRIASSELDNWANDAKHKVQATFLDASDGVRTAADPTGYSPQVSKAPDGRIYFVTLDGVSVIDPRHLPFNTLPPPVHVEQINADHKTYDASSNVTGDSSSYLRLPPLVRDLEIEYTALSLVAPEKVRFRYKLEGRDRDWQDVGTRRQAFYTDLSPGPYRFRVIASNNSGVWNEAGASLDFSITPAYYQTLWFRLCVVAALLSVVGALYQLRQRQIVGQFNMRLEERVSERTRIARDLHDTLLQSFHGVLLRFQSAAILLPDRPVDARKALESGIDQAAEALAEGRDAVQGLRSSVVATKDLPSLMSALGEELTADRTDQHAGDFRVQVEGTPRDFAPLVQDEVYWIAREALRNAFRHAHAGRIQVEVRFDSRRFRLRVRDDGKGMDQAVVDGGGRSGHYGLAGMRERARLLRGTLAIWSELDSGTEVELTIPGSVAYAKSPVARPAKYSGEVVG